jgi:tRNA (mo5U34)-methyltransferase
VFSKKQPPKSANDFYWYHCVDLGNGQVTDGDYAMDQYLPHYNFPLDMTDMSVLDVGRASGYFSFEFESRGASVTATELRSINDWDFVGGEEGRKKVIERISKEGPDFEERQIRGAFNFAHAARKSTVKPIDATAYELNPDLFGGSQFDLVFAGSITSHLKNPMLAMEKLHSVTGGKCIVSAPFIDLVEHRDLPLMALVGRNDTDHRSWWIFNAKGLEEMLYTAGFKRVEIVSHFNLQHRKLPELVFPHIVAHATP